tara:strand:+ start:9969 stop:11051 length:1083 start_codon:yes stop_codon:yes gene_type:complete
MLTVKIVFIASAASIHSIRWVRYFVEEKHEIILISLAKPNHETKIELNKFKKQIRIFYFNNLKSIFKTINFLLCEQYSLVHIHYLGWHSLLSLFISKKAKLILTPWGSDLLKNKYFFKKIFLNFIFRKANYLICDSDRLAKESIKMGMKKERIQISMFGVDSDIYKKTRTIFNNKIKFFVGSNRKLEKIYDVITFLKTAELICQIRKDIFFYVAGSGTLKETYMKYVKDKKISKNVKFLGLLNRKEMLNFYNNIDIYVSTSLSDGGLAASIAEAMSFERLIIISDNSDNKLWIKNKINGFLYKTKDHKALSKLILNAIEKKENSIQISKKSREIITNKYSYKTEMKNVENKYLQILGNSN